MNNSKQNERTHKKSNKKKSTIISTQRPRNLSLTRKSKKINIKEMSINYYCKMYFWTRKKKKNRWRLAIFASWALKMGKALPFVGISHSQSEIILPKCRTSINEPWFFFSRIFNKTTKRFHKVKVTKKIKSIMLYNNNAFNIAWNNQILL